MCLFPSLELKKVVGRGEKAAEVPDMREKNCYPYWEYKKASGFQWSQKWQERAPQSEVPSISPDSFMSA